MTVRSDAIVLGAGIVGVSTALNLQQRGWSVTLVDREQPGLGTSFGNGGLIQREAIIPYSFPQKIGTILSYALNRRRDSYYHLNELLQLAPIIYKYWINGRPDALARTIRANIPLYEHCVTEHFALAKAAGVEAMFRPNGWIRAFRSAKTRDAFLTEHEAAKQYGVDGTVLSKDELALIEPHITAPLVGGLQYRAPYSLANPLALTKAYETLFVSRGGKVLTGDARSMTCGNDNRWEVTTSAGSASAPNITLALGPWSDDAVRRLGYKIPFFVKRGYHMHYKTKGNAVLNSPVYDVDGGYMLTPMDDGIRLVTGAEFSRRDAPPSPIQLNRVEPWAREFFPIGARKASEPWIGSRPCLPDMLPVVGAAPAHKGLWFAFGHAHHGLTLAAVTGRLIAELMTNETPFTDPRPYRIDRF
ncbi:MULTISPECIES: FAD-binding oxidoreductase [unclassified Bradyrhizobium]|uniref:NAD(P)/FAD-dependent oxidoreductase n=1 Tax=unclassified Bradyrhizobium TaxID=2631580 RepID=UPI0028E9D2FC|nr:MULTISPECIES: FAD-binding oxidoreductase [unclassified Bradyrhizobium]